MLKMGAEKTENLLLVKNGFTILQLTTLISKANKVEDLSNLYTNRGALYYDNGNYEWALNDLSKAIEYNHLNYAAYYNVFTILSQLPKDEECNSALEGLKNLCCGLSCLYLLRGKNKNNETDVSKCVKLAENNCEGRLLRALQYTKKEKYVLALNQLKWVLDLQPSNLDILQIKSFIKSKLKGSQKGRYDQLEEENQNQESQRVEQIEECGKRLKCSLYDDISQEQDFNLQQQIRTRLQQFQSVFKDLFGPKLFQIKMEKHDNKFITIIDSPPQVINEIPQINNKQPNVSTSIIQPKQEVREQQYVIENQLAQSSGFGLDSRLNAYLRSSNNKNSQRQSFEGSSNSFLTVRALDDQNKRINIKVGKIRVVQNQQEQASASNNNLYCSFQFGQPRLELIKSTPQSGLYQQSIKVEEEEEARMLKVKVFKKQILSFNDKFVGKGQQEIKGPGKYDIVLYNSVNNQIEDVGYVQIYVQYF